MVLGACGARGPVSPDDNPHPLRTADERSLAKQYTDFVRALQRRDESAICRDLLRPLAEAYRCGGRPGIRIPRKLRGLRVAPGEILAADDDVVPDVIQISAETLGDEAGRFIVFFRRTRSGDWRIEKTFIGGYG